MYYRQRESDPKAAQAYVQEQKAAAATRLKTIAAKRKAAKSNG